MRYLVIPDLHGNWRALDALQDAARIPTNPDARAAEGIVTVQLGDLANCVAASIADDLTILDRARKLLDVVLVGNHEHPYFGGPTFSGFWRDPEVRTATGWIDWQPSFRIGDVLLTHAGVTPEMAAGYDGNVANLDDDLRNLWIANRAAAVFSQVGRSRAGRWSPDELGGILWSDATEPRASFRQIHGHTVVRQGPLIRSPRLPDPVAWTGSINLDVGMGKSEPRAVALWVEADGTLGDLVDVRLDPATDDDLMAPLATGDLFA